ncbi:hypothetical protein PPL_07644 [Heterostelium album PN500]|uniref:Uncharacterized protein n=1 Tax=Heterostelium pallidum (strain ATCC 26659 / Pp 5 / PN500) TaxID=670386 RepID=D3BGJ2_HETP5|nr:hypothetical protein PPL_07644 [Heterostelium album PN500]EFA79226.1 hypothetical protein PPL_07644 [Heterostelium album PN500]|eukprot:XP_020431347.1 hypothetical protein PPL_07644 [Heterostelium album PN500]
MNSLIDCQRLYQMMSLSNITIFRGCTTVKRLVLLQSENTQITNIPFGTEELYINCEQENTTAKIQFNFNNAIPSSVRELGINTIVMLNPRIVPSSVESFVHWSNERIFNFPAHLIPDSIQDFTCYSVCIPLKIKNIYISTKNKCSIRKLDEQYYLMVGHPIQRFIATIFHKSEIVKHTLMERIQSPK